MSRLRLNPLTGLFDYDPVIPPDFVQSVQDTPTIDLDVTAGVLTANLISLTGFDTDDLAEGPTNLYFTNERVDDRVAVLIQNGTGLNWTYNDVANTFTGNVTLAPFTTTNLAEGNNLYFTDERAQDAVGIALTDTATIDLTYNDALNQISAAVIADSITNALLADMPANTIKGNNTGALANPIDLTVTQATAMLNAFVGDPVAGGGGTKGMVPAPPSFSTAKQFVLRANGLFDSPNPRHSPQEAITAVSTWTGQSMVQANQWFGAVWSPEDGQYVAVASSGTNRVATSPDGVNWTMRTAASARVWTKVAYSPDLRLYVAVAFDGTTADAVMTSPDGITWTSRTVPEANQWYDIVWAPALRLFVACSINGTNRIMTSPDGITWTSRTIAAQQWYSLCWSPELQLFCAVSITGTNYVATSPDGITWTLRALTTGNTWYSVTWARELGLFVTVGATGTNRCATSPDGITWTLRAISTNAWRRVEYAPSLRMLMAVASNGIIHSSPDGITWTNRTSPEANQWYECVWSPEREQFLILGITGTSRALTSKYIGVIPEIAPKVIHNIADTASVDLSVSSTGILTAVATGAGIDHGLLTGLADDDHLQYHTDGRALTWLGTRSTTDLPEGLNLYFTNARARLAISGAGGSPINYNNVTGIIDLSIIPINYGGTGQSNAQAAINNLSNNSSVAVEGDVFQWLGGNAQFAPLSIPALSGTPNTLAYYNGSGDLINDNYWAAYDDGRLAGSYNQTANDQSLFRVDANIIAADSWNNGNLIAGSYNNSGTMTGFHSLLNLNFSDNAVSTEFVNGLNIGTQIDVTNDKQLATFTSSGTVGANLSGLYIDSADDVTGNTNLFNINAHGNYTGQVTVANWGNQNAVGNQIRFLDWNNSGTVANNLSGLFLNSQGAVTKGLDFLALNVTGNVGDGTGVNVNGLNMNIQNTAVINGGIYGLALSNSADFSGTNNNLYGGNINNQGAGYRYVGFSSNNNANLAEEIRGFQHNTQGSSRTSTGLDISMSGNSTDDAQGIRVNVSNQTSTNTRVRSLDINGHTYSYNNMYAPLSGLFVDTGNNNFTEFRIANGSPLTNTDSLINNNIVAFLAQDDVAIGPVGLGLAHTSNVSLLGVADTKTVDSITGLAIAASVQDPGYANAGTVTEYNGIRYLGALAGGGSTVIGTANGLVMSTGFDGYAGQNWGLRIQGTTAHNYVNQLAVGTASETAAAGLLHDVNGQIGITNIGSGVSIAEGINAKMGLAVLVAGTVTVANTAVTANSRIFLTNQGPSGSIGVLSIQNLIPGTSFDIVSTDPAETSTIAYLIMEAI